MNTSGKRALAGLFALALVASACGRGTTTTSSSGDAGDAGDTTAAPQKGGTLRMAMTGDTTSAFDPAKEYYSVPWGFFRCCLLRTLLSYNGLATEQGGDVLQPDLAESLPEVSDDELVWTFKLKPGIAYGPPLENVTVTAQDFVRALEREGDPNASSGGYPFYYSVIEGFDEFADGKADTITGVEAVDDQTLRITLKQPAGELPYLMAMPAMAPIPPNPDDPDARLGIAEGHTRDFGRFLVGTGPYMFEGTDQLDFSVPAKDQEPVSGYEPGRSIVLVRNPSWDASTDPLRPAYVDEIETSIGGTESDLANKVLAGEIDMVYDSGATPDEVAKYAQDPALQGRLFANADDGVAYASFNIAEPPFDDMHVRRALNYAINRDALLRAAGGPMQGSITTHIMPPSLLGGLNRDYDPFASTGNQGDIEKAKEEMKLSKYDTDKDGVCDDPDCEDVLIVSEEQPSSQRRVEIIGDSAEELGIGLDNHPLEIGAMYAQCEDPTAHTAICMNASWGKDFADGITYGPPLFGDESLNPACCNYGLVGASPEYLKKNGYKTTEVPAVDDAMEACALLKDEARSQCWADLDSQLSETVVPWIPLRFTNYVVTVSDRVVGYTFDQFAGQPSLDHIGVSDAAGGTVPTGTTATPGGGQEAAV